MLLVNEILNNRYRIVRQLGRGGMGAVYEAHDNVFETTCAIKEIMIDMAKVPSQQQQELIKLAFEREAKLLAKIKHEVVPHVRDYFSHENRQFLVMELVEGQELGDMMEERKKPFPLPDVLRWLEQLLDGLDYLHTQNPPIYHRDIKPQNLKLTPRGKMKLLDFGIAKGGAETKNSTVGNQTFVAATLNYSPIEQTFRVLDPVFREVLLQRFETRIKDVMEQTADARTDIYALGATVYHLLTGHLPIDSLKRTTEVWSGKPDPLTNPSTLNTNLPPEISALLLKSMEIDRNNRYISAIEMQQALTQANSAIRARERQQTPPATVWQTSPSTDSDMNAPTLEQPFKDAPTMQISADQLGQKLAPPSISEQTIQAAPNNYGQPPINVPINTGGQQPPPGSPFNTGGQQFNTGGQQFNTGGQQSPPQTEHYNFVGNQAGAVSGGQQFNTGGQQFNTGGQQFNTGGQQANTGGAAFTPTPIVGSTGSKSRAWLWILPVLAILFLAIGGGAVGVWYWQQSQTAETTPTPAKPSPSATPAVSPSPSPTENVVKDATPSPSPTATASPSSTKVVTSNPTPKPNTPKPNTPKPNTPKPRPKGSDCIFTGDC